MDEDDLIPPLSNSEMVSLTGNRLPPCSAHNSLSQCLSEIRVVARPEKCVSLYHRLRYGKRELCAGVVRAR